MAEVIYNGDEDKTRALLVGRRIVAAEEGAFPVKPEYGYGPTASGRLTLDNGTQVLVVPNEGGCACSSGDYYLKHLAKVDNIITDVRLAVEDVPVIENGVTYTWTETSYRIYVVADAVEINAVQIDGDDGSGYYGTGYALYVVPQGAE